MAQKIYGNKQGLAPSQIKQLERLYQRKIARQKFVSNDLAREICSVANELKRKVAVLISREGKVEFVVIGTRDIVYLPDLGRYRVAKGRLRRLRLILSDISKSENNVLISQDIYTDLEKLRLDAVCSVKLINNQVNLSYAWNVPSSDKELRAVSSVENIQVGVLDFNFQDWIQSVENELSLSFERNIKTSKMPAMLVGIYPKDRTNYESAMLELEELARTAGVEVVDRVVQVRKPDPKTLVGKGKLEEIMLRAIRHDIELIIFDSELSPSQWRAITNATELKIIDRSMLILDIFAQHAKTRDGKLQVELAQLKYNLPRLVEKDAGLSRLTGGIGGRGPGETKLEVGRRRYRDKIRQLEKDIDKLGSQRALRRKRREGIPIPLVALIGYTNVGKSSLFNSLTKGEVLVENKLFATLDPTQKRIFLEHPQDLTEDFQKNQAILIDTVGFIRKLPKELVNAFRATLEEINQASLLLHILDASDPEINLRLGAVEKQLKDFKMDDIPRINVLNKIDLLNQEEIDLLKKEFDAVAVSAIKRIGFVELQEAINSNLKGKSLVEPVELS